MSKVSECLVCTTCVCIRVLSLICKLLSCLPFLLSPHLLCPLTLFLLYPFFAHLPPFWVCEWFVLAVPFLCSSSSILSVWMICSCCTLSLLIFLHFECVNEWNAFLSVSVCTHVKQVQTTRHADAKVFSSISDTVRRARDWSLEWQVDHPSCLVKCMIESECKFPPCTCMCTCVNKVMDEQFKLRKMAPRLWWEGMQKQSRIQYPVVAVKTGRKEWSSVAKLCFPVGCSLHQNRKFESARPYNWTKKMLWQSTFVVTLWFSLINKDSELT